MARRGENIYKRKDGRYEGRYVIGRSENGRTKFGYVYGRHYQNVRDELAKRKAERIGRGRSASTRITLNACMMKWFEEELSGSVKSSSYQTYLRSYQKHIAPWLGSVPVTRLDSAMVQGFAEALTSSGLSAGTVRNICRLLAACLRYAQEEGLIERNPCRRIRFDPLPAPVQRVLNEEEQEKLRHAALSSRELPILLAAYTGMRLGEICALKWEDVDWERAAVRISRTAQRVCRLEGGTILRIGTPKSHRSGRVVPLPAFLIELLKARLADAQDSDFIFGKSSRPAEPRNLQRRFQTLLKSIGITKAHFHTLRHTFASRLIELGVDIKTVSALLGHSSVRTTLDFYVHTRLERQRDAIERFCQSLP